MEPVEKIWILLQEIISSKKALASSHGSNYVRFGKELSFCKAPICQTGTVVFAANRILTPPEKCEVSSQIGKKLHFITGWNKERLIVYPTIPQETVSSFSKCLLNTCKALKVQCQPHCYLCEKAELSGTQILLKTRFSRPMKKRELQTICWNFSLETGLFCESTSNNEFIIDTQQKINRDEIRHKQQEEEKKKLYAQSCHKLAQKYDIPFINALKIGNDEEKIKKHAKSLERAISLIYAQEKAEKALIYYQLFRSSNLSTLEKALQSLGIYYGDANVEELDFSMLEKPCS